VYTTAGKGRTRIQFKACEDKSSSPDPLTFPPVLEGGDGVHIWTAAMNILNNRRGQPTGGVHSAWGIGWG